jgi:hypothetical protein
VFCVQSFIWWTYKLHTLCQHTFNAFYLLSSTVQYSTVQYSTVQYSTVQYSTVQYSTVQYCTVQYCTVQYCTVQYCIITEKSECFYVTEIITPWPRWKKNILILSMLCNINTYLSEKVIRVRILENIVLMVCCTKPHPHIDYFSASSGFQHLSNIKFNDLFCLRFGMWMRT